MEMFKEEKVNSMELLRKLYKRRWIIIATVALAIIIAFVITLITPPKFYSYGIIYPTNSNSLETVFDDPKFGYDVDADRLIQVLESETIRDYIIKEFDLVSYYQIDTSRLDWKYTIDKLYTQDITFFRSKYLSVVITAKTKDPKLSANIVNAIIDTVDGVRENIFERNQVTEINAIQADYNYRMGKVQMLEDSLEKLAETKPKLELLYFQIKYQGSDLGLAGFLDKLPPGSLTLDDEALISEYIRQWNMARGLKDKLEYAQDKLDRPFPGVFIVNRAQPSFRKYSPNFKLNILIAAGFAFIMSIIAVLAWDRFREVKEYVQQ